jgi:ribonuclease I
LRNEVTVLVSNAQEKYSMSNRKIFKVLNLSFTISLFKNNEDISAEDFFEALNLANLAR